MPARRSFASTSQAAANCVTEVGQFMMEEAGCSGRSSHAATDLRFAFTPSHQQQRLLRQLPSSSHSSSATAQPNNVPLLHLLRQSAMAAMNVQAAALGPQPTVPRSSGEHSQAQLWLQDQLSRIPFFRPLHSYLAGGATAPGLAAEKNNASSRMTLQQPKGLSPEDKSLWDMFMEMDVNGDGVIDEEELLSALIKLRLPCSPSYVSQMVTQFHDSYAARSGDSSESRTRILWEEFRSYVNKRDKQIEAAFREFDRDGNGVITAFEVGQALVKAGLPTTGRDIRKVMEVLGKDVNDTISYQDFRKFACFMPSLQVKNIDIASYVGWLWSAPVLTASSQRRKPNIITDPLQHFMAFDLVMRTCMVGSLALMVVMSVKLD